MTQVLGYRCPAGIIIATDSRAQQYGPEGHTGHLTVNKVFRLSPHVILVTAGAGSGMQISRAFQRHLAERNIWALPEICYQALPFMRSEHEKQQKNGKLPNAHEDLERVYFVIAGFDMHRPRDPYRLMVLGSEQAGDPLHEIPVGHVVSIPRQLLMETKMHQMFKHKTGPQKVGAAMHRFLQRLAGSTDDIGPPFHLVLITASGIRRKTSDA